MEFKGTIKSVLSFENDLVKSFPYIVTKDGSEPYNKADIEGGPQLVHKSPYYARVYQLFPEGDKKASRLGILLGKRVNVRFFYDERYGVGTVRISATGMSLLSNKISGLINEVEDIWIIPKKNMTPQQAAEYGATNLDGSAS